MATQTVYCSLGHDLRANAYSLGFIGANPTTVYSQTHNASESYYCFRNGYLNYGEVGHSIIPSGEDYNAYISRAVIFFDTVGLEPFTSAVLKIRLRKYAHGSGDDWGWDLSVRENVELDETANCDKAGYPLALEGTEIATQSIASLTEDYAFYEIVIPIEHIHTDRYTKIALVNSNDVTGTPPNGSYPAYEMIKVEMGSSPRLVLTTLEPKYFAWII